MVRLKSREGDVFDVESWILQISPVLSDVESSDEVPLPLVGTRALKLLLAHCAEQRARTRFQPQIWKNCMGQRTFWPLIIWPAFVLPSWPIAFFNARNSREGQHPLAWRQSFACFALTLRAWCHRHWPQWCDRFHQEGWTHWKLFPGILPTALRTCVLLSLEQ